MFENLKTPCYVIDNEALIHNLEILKYVKDKTNCKILLASKAFSMYYAFPLIGKYLDGVTSSGVNEARLGYEEMKKEVHIFSPAYIPSDFDDIVKYCNHIVFNSFEQYARYKDKAKGRSIGLRINPNYSEIDTPLYDPCGKNSRLGITLEKFNEDLLDGVEGLHFHTMCEQNSDTLKRTLDVFLNNFGKYLYKMKWVNFGGGHHITRSDYDLDTLIECINYVKETYNVEVYLEPGEAVALNAGYLVSSVLDFNYNGVTNCILDTSAACHMPDVLEMPYRPKVLNENKNGKYSYLFGGPTCLAGDIIGNYSFDKELKIGDKVVFLDMAIYTMVKNNTFNGINLPTIYYKTKDEIKLIKEFGYDDFKSRL